MYSMESKFFPTFFLIFYIILLSYAAYICDFKDCRYSIPNECDSSYYNETFATPTNHICSVSYLLFTKNNIDYPCYVEPKNQEFDFCQFDPYKPTRILIHGYTVQLKPGNMFERIKDSLLTVENSNVIMVNWTKYDAGEYSKAYLVGLKVGEFINFLVNEKGVNPAHVHIIAHSLGAHVAGVAGKQVPGLGRISGLDPASPLFNLSVTYNRLTNSDADFVDVMHCSNGVIANGSKGFGIPYPIGDVNFYPNGGVYQPCCEIGRSYLDTDGVTMLIKTNMELKFCRHDICPEYFLYSIRECEFLSKKCKSYKRFNMGNCFSNLHPVDMMGLHAEKIPGLPSHSKFYLNTTNYPPYCKDNCD